MSKVQIDSKQTAKEIHSQRSAFLRKIGSWFCIWEIYPILGIAAFLRFYQLTTTEFDADQALIFQMARDAINHGLIPATGIIASIRIANPPAVVYLFMIPAAISSNPLWGAIFVGLLNILGVLLTYIFVRRYYGRIASIIASLLYATAAEPLHFNRFIWQLNIIAPFVVLFIFALFWGVVDRRKGWLFPALVLLGILILLQISKLHSHFDLTALNYYVFFLNPYVNIPTNTNSLEYKLVPLLKWLSPTMAIFIVCGLALITIGVISSQQLWKRDSGVDVESRTSRHPVRRSLETVRTLWADFRATPQRCGYFLLLCWQIVPIIILSRHSVPVFPYYLLMVLPGPFIIIGILLSLVVHWLKRPGWMWNIPRYGVYVFTCFVIVAQLTGSMAGLVDEASGNNLHGYTYNTLNSLQDALAEADHVARQRHLNHVYITTNQFTQVALRYLAEQVQTPTTLFDASRCLVLPNPADGPAVLLVGPYDKLTSVLLGQFATSTLIDRPERLGGAPFQLFIVKPITIALSQSTSSFLNNLQLLDKRVRHFSYDNSLWLVTHWRLLRSASPGYRTTYTYTMRALLNGNRGPGISSQCISTSMRPGDQLIVAFQVPRATVLPVSVTISATSYTTMPYNLLSGPFHLETFRDQSTPQTTLTTLDSRDSITLSG